MTENTPNPSSENISSSVSSKTSAVEQKPKKNAGKNHAFERFFDMKMQGHAKEPQMPLFWAKLLGAVVGALCKILFRYTIKNQAIVNGFVGKQSGAVLVAPHVSYLDVVMMWESVRPQQFCRLIARDSLFTVAGGVLGFFIARCGAIPIQRNTSDRLAIKRATRCLKGGELVGIFPEGTRRGKGNVDPALHGGAAMIARLGKAPLIPVGFTNIDQVKQKNKRVRFPKITIVFGEPVAVSSFDFLPKEDRLDACSWYVLREAFALSRQCRPEEVDMTELFPASKDFAPLFAEHPIPRVDVAALPQAIESS